MSDESSSIDSSDQEITSEDDRSDEGTSDDPKKKDGAMATKKEGHENNASKSQPGKKLQAKWDEMFERLLEYKAEHGHCLVPNRYAKDPQLGSWGKQRFVSTLFLNCTFSQPGLQFLHNVDITKFSCPTLTIQHP